MICPSCGSSRRTPEGRCAACGLTVGSLIERVESEAVTIPPDAVLTSFSKGPNGDSSIPPVAENPTRANAGHLAPGQSFGARYRIIKLLGSGGMGAVYQAWDEELGVVVAIKVIRPEIMSDSAAAMEVEQRFKRELVLARQVTHKNVVRIHDLGEIDGIKYITMQFLQGQSLGTLLAQRGKLTVTEALSIVRQITSGLVAAHEVGVIHRDLKPANVMVDAEARVFIVDFGIARSAAADVTGNVVTGTLEYMAPEQARGRPSDQRVDIYALGLILLDLITGRQRLVAAPNAMAELMDRMERTPQPAASSEPGAPQGLDEIIARCVRPDPSQRYQTSAELLADLDSLGGDGKATARLTTSRAPASELAVRSAWRHRPLTVAAIGAGLVVMLVAGWAIAAGYVPWRRSGSGATIAAGSETLAVLPFRNASGDSSLDWLGESLAQMLTEDLSEVPQFSVASNERIFRLLSDLRVSPDESDAATLERIGDLSNAKVVISGRYVKGGARALRFEATIHDIGRGSQSQVTAQAPGPNEIAVAAQELARALLKRSDVAAGGVAGPLAPSSRSPQAIREYNIGLQFARDARYDGALKHFEAAVQADQTFALAYSKAAEMYANLHRDADAQRLSRTAVELSAKLPERERQLVEARHARLNNDTGKAISAYSRVVGLSPHDMAARFELGVLDETTGALGDAHEQFGQVLAADPKNLDALVAFGRVEIKRKNPQGALDPLNRALSLAIQFENEEARSTVLNAIGIAYKRLNRPDAALPYYRQSLEIRRRLGQRAGIASTLTEIAQVEQRLGQVGEARRSYENALAIRREMGDRKGTANSLIDFGQFDEDRGQYDEALSLYREALQIERDLGDQNYEALCLNNIGGAYFSKGLHAEALTYYERALEIREKLKATADIAQTLRNIGDASLAEGQYDRALKNYVRALELDRSVGDKRATAIASYSIGAILDDQGRYNAALKAKDEALMVFRQLQERSHWLAEILAGYGDTLGRIGRVDEARRQLSEAISVARELNNGALIARALNAQGFLSASANDWRTARATFSEALKEAARAGAQREMLESELNVAKADLAAGQPLKAATTLGGVVERARKAGLSYVSLDASISLAEARVAGHQPLRARGDLEAALRRSEESGLLELAARGHYVNGAVLRASGQGKEAVAEYAQALRLLNQIADETGTPDLVFRRADFSAIRREAEKWGNSP